MKVISTLAESVVSQKWASADLSLNIAPVDVWQGLKVNWVGDMVPDPVLLGYFDATGVFLFGVRWPLESFEVKGRPMPEGFFLEYVIVDGTSGKVTRLTQKRKPEYTDNEHSTGIESVSAVEIDSSAPVELLWPLWESDPMRNLGKVVIRWSEDAESKLTFDKAIYLFESSRVYVVTTLDLNEQTAEEHYATE